MTELLYIHGILGKPDYFDFLRPAVPEGYRPHAILLEGHGSTPREFARASMARWRRQVAETVGDLRSGGQRLIIAAHSMGCLFAIDAAVKGQADALFLLNPPLALRITRRLLTTPIKVLTGKIDDPRTRAAKEAYSISDDPNLFNYAGWIPRYLELFAEIRRTRPLASRLTVPTRVYLSAHDEMVSPRSARYFSPIRSARHFPQLPARSFSQLPACYFPHLPEISITTLPSSGHYYYAPSDRALLLSDFARFLKER